MNSKFLFLILLLSISSCTSKSDKKNNDKKFADLFKSNQGNFLEAKLARNFKFPEDHYKHEGYKTEWWYLTGNLDSGDRHFGYQLSIFRNSIDQNSKNDIWMGHMGISDVKNSKFYSYEIFENESMNLAGASIDPLKIWIDNWKINFSKEDIKIEAYKELNGFELSLKAQKKIVLQGDNGLSQKSKEKGNASYYYSISRLKTEGKIFIEGATFNVSGESWLDREWSTSSLGKEQVGWDWFAIQLDNDEEIMLYQLRNSDGSISEFSHLAYIDKDSQKKNYGINDFSLKPTQYKEINGIRYPLSWEIIIKEKNLKLKIEAYFEKQVHESITKYWEGAIKVEGYKNTKKLCGKGYLEMTGYLPSIRQDFLNLDIKSIL
jgi:predicted secreted hydrolase